MFDIVVWGCYELKNAVKRRVINHKRKKVDWTQKNSVYALRPTKIAGEKLMLPPQVNQVLADKIRSGEPFWAGRMGFTEMNLLRQGIEYNMVHFLDHRAGAVNDLYRLSGFFPEDVALGDRFVDLYLSDAAGIDMQGFWGLYMEDYLLKKYQHTPYKTQLNWLEPWNMYLYPESSVKPWTSALKGKKVLVIHPFAESIEKQYRENRERIFGKIYPAEDILPEFELITLKAVQTLGGTNDPRFATWFEALDWMKSQCHSIDFDVAIIGCGAYGYPLAAECKRMGKIAVHLGGATQLLFGIIGNRWETEYRDFHQDVVNEYWTRPLETERPECAKDVEKGCYW